MSNVCHAFGPQGAPQRLQVHVMSNVCHAFGPQGAPQRLQVHVICITELDAVHYSATSSYVVEPSSNEIFLTQKLKM